MLYRLIRAYFSLFTFYAMGLVDTVRNAQAIDIRTAVDAQASAGKLVLYTATRPAKGAAITSQLVLATLVLNKTGIGGATHGSFYPIGTAEGGTQGLATLNTTPAISDTNAGGPSHTNSGVAAWARLVDGGDNFVADLTVTVTGGGGDVTIDNTTITAGGTVNLTGGTITIGNAT